MTAAYLALVRTCYALVVILTTGFAGYVVFIVVQGGVASLAAFAIALAAAAFLMLGYGALRRKMRGEALVPPPAGYRDWLYVSLMTASGAFAHFLTWNVCLAIYQYLYVFPDRDREGGALAFFMIIAATGYLIALLFGEFALRHGDENAQPRISPPSGFADALSGNTRDSSAADDTPR